jgi:hypothetical protein
LKSKEIAARIRHMSAQDKTAARKLNMTDAEFAQKMALEQSKLANQQARTKVMQRKNAIQEAKALSNPSAIKPITLTHRVWVPKNTLEEANAKLGKGDYGYDKKTGRYYKYLKETITTGEWQRRHGTAATRDPQEMFKILRGMGYSPESAAEATKLALGVDPRKKKK